MVGSHGARCSGLVTQVSVHLLDTRVLASLNVAGHWESLGGVINWVCPPRLVY